MDTAGGSGTFGYDTAFLTLLVDDVEEQPRRDTARCPQHARQTDGDLILAGVQPHHRGGDESLQRHRARRLAELPAMQLRFYVRGGRVRRPERTNRRACKQLTDVLVQQVFGGTATAVSAAALPLDVSWAWLRPT